MQEEINHEEHKQERDDQSYENLLHAFRNRKGLVKRYGVIDVLGEAPLHLGHELSDTCYCLNRIGSRQLVDGEDGTGLAVQPADKAVVVRAQLDASDVSRSNHPAVRGLAYHDVAELIGRFEAALRYCCISELLICGRGRAAHLTGRIHGVLRLYGVGDVRDGDAQLGELIGLYP